MRRKQFRPLALNQELGLGPAERAAVLSAVSRETGERLDRYVDLLLHWQRQTNLIAPSTVPQIWSRHVADSLGLWRVASAPKHWLDLGSGGGFPGVVLGIMNAERGGSVDLVESNGKKAAFLRAALDAADIRGQVHAARVEDCGALFENAEAVSARALASLETLFSLVWRHLPPDIPCFFPKGRGHEQEIAEASAHWRFTMVKHQSDVENEAVILEIRDISPVRDGG
ncbi:16S rRNA (guanine(527)-N(7))-methyltransferase RsmG [Consotaella aegiceratis]|uniref:16S rRNA (guanine(527)-N(7))-methyltransferase RsmG n=1 Tax=Consotaella aegiceratis TaxID=3097961 RepID=UPI002F3F6AA5